MAIYSFKLALLLIITSNAKIMSSLSLFLSRYFILRIDVFLSDSIVYWIEGYSVNVTVAKIYTYLLVYLGYSRLQILSICVPVKPLTPWKEKKPHTQLKQSTKYGWFIFIGSSQWHCLAPNNLHKHKIPSFFPFYAHTRTHVDTPTHSHTQNDTTSLQPLVPWDSSVVIYDAYRNNISVSQCTDIQQADNPFDCFS